jgi:hypothetical protein
MGYNITMMKTKPAPLIVKPSEIMEEFGGDISNIRAIGWWLMEKMVSTLPDEDDRIIFGEMVWENSLDLSAGRAILPYLKAYLKNGADRPVEVVIPGWGWETVEARRCQKGA